MERVRLTCCYIDPESGYPDGSCDKPAEWQIEVDNQALHPSEAYTHACTDHVGALLWQDGQHRVFPAEAL